LRGEKTTLHEGGDPTLGVRSLFRRSVLEGSDAEEEEEGQAEDAEEETEAKSDPQCTT
jgi:hypothetical protein